ncbi:MAG: TetR/AcrR family transcriptional regulator [Dehalococcoidia bacterium]|nr:TetR/AcrR family transcriptional regulator [Dehalococcoidia bacterium]
MSGIKRKNTQGITRERIIEAAFSVFNNVDFTTATIRDIARASGISPASIYKHFKSKEDMLDAITVEKIRQMDIDLRHHLVGIKGVLNKLRKMTWFYLDLYDRDNSIAWTLYITTSPTIWKKSRRAWETAVLTGRLFKDIIREGQRSGEISRTLNIRVLEMMYFGALRHICIFSLVGTTSESVTHMSDMADDLTEMTYRAIRSLDKQEAFICPYSTRVVRARPGSKRGGKK